MFARSHDYPPARQRIIVISAYKVSSVRLFTRSSTECLVILPIMVDNFAELFHCMPADRISWLGPELFRLLLSPPGLNG